MGHQLRPSASSKSDFPPASLSQSLEGGPIFPESCPLREEDLLGSCRPRAPCTSQCPSWRGGLGKGHAFALCDRVPTSLTSCPRGSSVALSSGPHMPRGPCCLADPSAWKVLSQHSLPLASKSIGLLILRGSRFKCHLHREVLGASSPQEACPVPPPPSLQVLSVRLRCFPSQNISVSDCFLHLGS